MYIYIYIYIHMSYACPSTSQRLISRTLLPHSSKPRLLATVVPGEGFTGVRGADSGGMSHMQCSSVIHSVPLFL